MTEVHAFSLLTGEDIDLGVEVGDPDEILDLADLVATGHDNLIVHLVGPKLQQWEGFQ